MSERGAPPNEGQSVDSAPQGPRARWQPSRSQWLAIWGSSIPALTIWSFGGDEEGISGRFALSLLIIGALVVWRLGQRGKTSRQSSSGGYVGPIDSLCPSCARAKPQSSDICTCGAVLVDPAVAARLTGFGGWLAFVCVALIVFTPLSALASFSRVFVDLADWSAVDAIRASPSIILIGGSALAAVLVGSWLATRRTGAVWAARLYFKASLIAVVGLVVWVGLSQSTIAAAEFAPQMLGGILGALLWLNYFSRSKRVLLTFGVSEFRKEVTGKWTLGVTAAVAIVVLVPAVVLRANWPTTGGTWISYSHPGAGFTVQLPGTPQETSEMTNTGEALVDIKSATIETADGLAFALSHFTLPDSTDIGQPHLVIDGMLNGVLKETPPGSVSEGRQELALPGGGLIRETQVRVPDSNLRMRVRVYLRERRALSAIAVSADPVPSSQLGAIDPDEWKVGLSDRQTYERTPFGSAIGGYDRPQVRQALNVAIEREGRRDDSA